MISSKGWTLMESCSRAPQGLEPELDSHVHWIKEEYNIMPLHADVPCLSSKFPCKLQPMNGLVLHNVKNINQMSLGSGWGGMWAADSRSSPVTDNDTLSLTDFCTFLKKLE